MSDERFSDKRLPGEKTWGTGTAIATELFRVVPEATCSSLDGRRRNTELDDIGRATCISDRKLLVELVESGLRADSLRILTLVPLIHVAWSNGRVEREERSAILAAAAQEGIRPESAGFLLLDAWLSCRPDQSLMCAWKKYVAAVRTYLSSETYNAFHLITVDRAWKIAEAAGGLLGILKVSRAEQAAIHELNLAFSL